jgi:AraC-like DNA-binding protein
VTNKCFFVTIFEGMKPELIGGIWFSIPVFSAKETVSSLRYKYNNLDRGDDPFAIVQWTQSGEGVFVCERGTFKVPAGYAFVSVVPEVSNYYYPPKAKEPWVFEWFNVYGSMACEVFRKFQAEFGPVVPLPLQSATATAFRRLITCLSNPEGPNRWQVSIETYSLVLEWWREASHQTGTVEDGLERALRFCQEHFREQLSVKQIAYETGMSREHFSRSFTERFKETPAGFLRRLRLNEATAFLRDTRLPLREIAIRAGFYSVRHMMRTFQRVYGTSPSQYRRHPPALKK